MKQITALQKKIKKSFSKTELINYETIFIVNKVKSEIIH